MQFRDIWVKKDKKGVLPDLRIVDIVDLFYMKILPGHFTEIRTGSSYHKFRCSAERKKFITGALCTAGDIQSFSRIPRVTRPLEMLASQGL